MSPKKKGSGAVGPTEDILAGRVCRLVPFGEEHLNDPRYLAWLRDYEVVKTINRLDYVRPVSFAEVREYCEGVMRSPNDIFLAIVARKGERFIGTLRVSQINWHTRTADIGILVGDRDFWGKGIATDAISAVGRHLLERLGMRRLTAGLMSVNPAMKRAFEKLGFRVEGVFRKHDRFEGEYVDHIFLGCMKEEFLPAN